MADGLFGYLPVDREPTEGEDEKNTFCRAGALRLKAKIEAYWAERGKHVRVKLDSAGFNPAVRAARVDIRSDMLNGYPRELVLPPEEHA